MDDKLFQERIRALKEQEKELLKNPGWYVHYVFETKEKEWGGLANIHTHGLKENFDHPDLQVVLPIDPNTIHPVLTGLVGDIKNERRFRTRERVPYVLEGMDVSFIAMTEGGRGVLRLLFPDPEGKLPFDDGCDPFYARQLELLPK